LEEGEKENRGLWNGGSWKAVTARDRCRVSKFGRRGRRAVKSSRSQSSARCLRGRPLLLLLLLLLLPPAAALLAALRRAAAI
jgi:hypothetical protein